MVYKLSQRIGAVLLVAIVLLWAGHGFERILPPPVPIPSVPYQRLAVYSIPRRLGGPERWQAVQVRKGHEVPYLIQVARFRAAAPSIEPGGTWCYNAFHKACSHWHLPGHRRRPCPC